MLIMNHGALIIIYGDLVLMNDDLNGDSSSFTRTFPDFFLTSWCLAIEIRDWVI